MRERVLELNASDERGIQVSVIDSVQLYCKIQLQCIIILKLFIWCVDFQVVRDKVKHFAQLAASSVRPE